MNPPPKQIVVMGVSGSGKTTIGKALASRLDLCFYDADDFHPASNRSKMAAGLPLTDEDRLPWLNELAHLLFENRTRGIVLACSALKQHYRDRLSEGNEKLVFIYLKGDYDRLLERMQKRQHFMPASLLKSQFQTLEEPVNTIVVEATLPAEIIVKQCIMQLVTS